MSSLKPMPRLLVVIAGGLILLMAVIGVYLGASRNGNRYNDADVAGVVPTSSTPNAHALTGPVVDEAEVRRWAHEEVVATLAKPVVKKPPAADGSA